MKEGLALLIVLLACGYGSSSPGPIKIDVPPRDCGVVLPEIFELRTERRCASTVVKQPLCVGQSADVTWRQTECGQNTEILEPPRVACYGDLSPFIDVASCRVTAVSPGTAVIVALDLGGGRKEMTITVEDCDAPASDAATCD